MMMELGQLEDRVNTAECIKCEHKQRESHDDVTVPEKYVMDELGA